MNYESTDAAQRGLESIMKPNLAATNSRRRKARTQSDPLGANSEIGRKLRQYYDELITEDVPDRFADLLRKLEDHERGSVSPDGE